MNKFQPLPAGSVLLLGIWLVVLLGGALGVKTVFHITRLLPERMPMVVMAPSTPMDGGSAAGGHGGPERPDTSATSRVVLENALVDAGVRIEFVPKEAGLEMLRARIGKEMAADDSAVLAGLVSNPLSDVYVIRADRPEKYARVREILETAMPAAKIRFASESMKRLAPVLTACRILSIAALALLCGLFCFSMADHLRVKLAEWVSELAGGYVSALGIFLRAGLVAILSCIIGLGGLLTLLGLSADRHPEWAVKFYADLAGRFFKTIAPDWKFFAEFLLGLLALMLISVWLRAPRHGHRSHDAYWSK